MTLLGGKAELEKLFLAMIAWISRKNSLGPNDKSNDIGAKNEVYMAKNMRPFPPAQTKKMENKSISGASHPVHCLSLREDGYVFYLCTSWPTIER